MNSSTQSDDHYTATQLTRTNIGSDESAVSGSNLLAMGLASDEPSGGVRYRDSSTMGSSDGVMQQTPYPEQGLGRRVISLSRRPDGNHTPSESALGFHANASSDEVATTETSSKDSMPISDLMISDSFVNESANTNSNVAITNSISTVDTVEGNFDDRSLRRSQHSD